MRRALCTVAALAAMICVAPGARGGDSPASVERTVPATTAVYQHGEQGLNVRPVDYPYGYRYGSPYYRYGYRSPSYGYRYPNYGYRYSYPQYGYGYPQYGYGYRYGSGYRGGYPTYRYGYRPGVSFGFRF